MPNIRFIAIDVLHQALTTRTPPEFIALDARHMVGAEDARFARAMVLEVMRHFGQLNMVVGQYVAKPLPKAKHWVQCALLVGAAQLLCMNTPAHAAIFETVEAIKQSKFKALSGMVNAVLNKLAREKTTLPDVVCNWPKWLYDALGASYNSTQLQQMALVAASLPPYDVNTVLAAPESVLKEGQALNKTHWRFEDEAAFEAALWQHNAWFVQDIAASFPVECWVTFLASACLKLVQHLAEKQCNYLPKARW